MVHLTRAIGDFVLMLISAILWTGLGFAAWALLGAGAIGGIVWWRARRRR